jgi:ppGpp synthetase/RelA/SpoT-type nucleotidyltranferase
MNMRSLQESYDKSKPRAQKFAHRLCEQMAELLIQENVSLAVPIEFRIKEWISFKVKVENKKLTIADAREMEDFIGLRIIPLFKRDADRVCSLVSSTFEIIKQDDASQRLDVSQFGYHSTHFHLKLPKEWLRIPTFDGFGDFSAELQVRTAAQHIWAAASHVLQYKQEESVPPPVLRSINRVSALLETVDLEFERALYERESYTEALDVTADDEPLNVDNLRLTLDKTLPQKNKEKDEPYSLLLKKLQKRRIHTTKSLRHLLIKHRKAVLEKDRNVAQALVAEDPDLAGGLVTTDFAGKTYGGRSGARIRSGVFFSHVGLVIEILNEFEPAP